MHFSYCEKLWPLSHVLSFIRDLPNNKCSAEIAFLWLLWCAISSISTVTNKSLLMVFPYPISATTNQLAFTCTLAYLSTRAARTSSAADLFGVAKKHIRSFLILTFFNIICIGCLHFGFFLLSASYMHTGNSEYD